MISVFLTVQLFLLSAFILGVLPGSMIFVPIALTLFILKPKYLFSFSTVTLFNFSAYVALPAFVTTVLSLVSYEYQLTWVADIANSWRNLNEETVYLTWCLFLSMYLLAYLVENKLFRNWSEVRCLLLNIDGKRLKSVTRPFYLLTLPLLALTGYIFSAMGGFDAFLNDYSTTFLTKRKGLGLYIIFASALMNVWVFLAGLLLANWNVRGKLLLLSVAIPLLLIQAYTMGFKSRLIILVLLLLMPYVLNIRLTFKTLFIGSALFFVALFTTSYVRTNGYYSGFLFVEMIVAYFNVIPLHEKMAADFAPASLFSVFWFLNKYLNPILGTSYDYDLSIYLTKIYFPREWYVESATQQWSIISQAYINFGVNAFALLPAIIAAFYQVICLLLLRMYRTNSFFIFITIMETLRVLTIFKGGVLQHDLYYVLISYAIYFLILYRIRV